jgi:hypothetical protein
MAFYAVTMVHGPNWDPARPIREQDGWDEHARFMDELVDAGFVYFGGPIDDGEQALLAVTAGDEPEVVARMDSDPWASLGVLRIGEIRRWSIWLDGSRRRAR